MRRKTIIFIIICILIFGVGYIYLNYFKKKSDVVPAVSNFNKAIVVKGEIKQSITESSVLESNKRQEVRFASDGTVEKVYIDIGQQVNQGDILLTLESNTENTSLEITKKNLELEQKELDELKKDLNNLKIYAPEDGEVMINVNEGERVQENSTIGTVTDNTKMEIITPMSKSVIKNINVGDKANIFLSDNFSTIEGTVTDLGQSSKASEAGYVYSEVTISFENPGGLYEGMLGQVKIVKSSGTYASIENIAITNKESEDLRVDTGGKIKRIYVNNNDVVKKGDLIAVIDESDILSQIEKQEIVLEQGQLSLEDKYESLDDVAIKAPLTGTIVSLDIADGDNIDKNDTVCVISDTKDLKVVIPIDELDVFKITQGQKAIITTDVFPDKEYMGKVVRAALEGVESNGVSTFDVTVDLEQIGKLRVGMTVNTEIVIAESDNTLMIPIEAVQKRGEKNFVLINTEGNKDSLKEVEIGLMNESYVEIKNGLSEGDDVYYSSTISTNQENIGGSSMRMIPGMGRPSGGSNRSR